VFQRLVRYAPLLVAAVALCARLLPEPRTIDDAFITFRYARNLLAGLGFVFNPGEHVLGTTTPLYTLLLAGVSGLTRVQSFPWLALWVNALADAVTCVVLVRLGEKLSGRRAVGWAAAWLWAIAPMSVTFAIGGMETSIFVLLLTLGADLYLSGKGTAAALTSALLLLTRPDGILFTGPLILDALGRGWRTRRWPRAEALVFSLTLAPWLIFATLYFGTPIPHSVAAKTLAYRLPPLSALVRLIQQYGTPFFEQNLLGNTWPLAGFVLYFGLTVIGGLGAVRRDSRTWPLALYPWLYLVVFAAANPLIFRWYLAPPLPFYFLLILTGLAKLGEDLHLPAARFLPHAFGLLAFGFSIYAWTLRPDHGPRRPERPGTRADELHP